MQVLSRWPGTAETEAVPEDWIFEDPQSRALLAEIEHVAPSDASVLISGETGTGKELIARYIHSLSLRRHAPFLTVSCGAFSEAQVEIELFGHESGAFAGAFGSQVGRLEQANGGTLFLDEIDDLPPLVQTRLLRALKGREVTRLGGQQGIAVDVRIVASTTRRFTERITTGQFRTDLYYHLNVVNLETLPLSERSGDIVPIARYFIKEYSRQLNYSGAALTSEAEQALKAYPWQGNVRELENVVHRTLLMSGGGEIDTTDLRFPAHQTCLHVERNADAIPASGQQALRLAVRRLCEERPDQLHQLIEDSVFDEVFQYCRQSQSETARVLGISRNIVRARLMRTGGIGTSRRRAAADAPAIKEDSA
ncbi:Fis family transcriptional regulator [Burkholderia sp. SRS-W-2-2016]|uniref:sigma 54-interacting transcriptional regulator n=1 Tax=Burkholderia sp. SRS-W-2-2016 TaxID=1926878 RepID=UPI00094B125D|nr:sigma-54 dependent transcriptional regulator [Burkholderia sp. SRS-W-2-2016]OLL27540.1 Fis family transcriptional regulator [Burkholderia sp. SRS-W-2-2016]